jgi:hypothetical protein
MNHDPIVRQRHSPDELDKANAIAKEESIETPIMPTF